MRGVPNTIESVLDRLDTTTGPEGCWTWSGVRDRKGYGRVRFGGQQRSVHRLIAEHFIGPIAGMTVRHTCDNPPCGNPKHLLVGTAAENMADKAARGRAPRGAAHPRPNAKLTPDDVRAIRSAVDAGRSHVDVAREFGVSRPCVSRIVSGVLWGWVA